MTEPDTCLLHLADVPDLNASVARVAAADHYGTDMAAKKPLIKTTAIQYCLDNAGGADDTADVSSASFQIRLC